MNKTALNIIFLFLVLIPAQAVIFNNLVICGVAIPIVFIYLIIALPMTIKAVGAMTCAFLAGLAVDVLSDTPGLNAVCACVIAFARRPLFHLYVPVDNDPADKFISPRSVGAAAFLKYAATLIFAYCLLLFFLEALQIFYFPVFLLRLVASSLYSFLFIALLACLTNVRREKRL